LKARKLTGAAGASARAAVGALLLVVTALVAVAWAASTDFVEPASSPVMVGVGPHGIVAANFDADADTDLATVNISGGNVTILRNNGSGRFTALARSPDAGSFPDALAAADLDGDADQDLAVANQVSNDVTILRNNGAGAFNERPTSPEAAGMIPAAVTTADLDGDGDQDLAVANATEPTGTVTILRNNGAGNFTEPASSPEVVGDKAISVAAADFDGDHDQDLAVANQQSGNVSILLNRGHGNFDPAATSPEPAGTFPQGVAVIDLEGDHDPDLAITNQGSSNITLLRNNGHASFSEPPSSPVPVGARPLAPAAVADFEGDGDQDLAEPNIDDDDVTVLRSNGHGSFGEPATSPEGVGDGPISIAAADFDGDLDPDLATANENVSTVTILRNR
jgi:hypothetical protein